MSVSNGEAYTVGCAGGGSIALGPTFRLFSGGPENGARNACEAVSTPEFVCSSLKTERTKSDLFPDKRFDQGCEKLSSQVT